VADLFIIKSGEKYVSIRSASIGDDAAEARVRVALSDYAHVFDDSELAAEMAERMRDGGNAATLYQLVEVAADGGEVTNG
jgi:hypothetical protein